LKPISWQLLPTALDDRRMAHAEVEQALAVADPDRLILLFAMVAPWDLLKSLPRHETAHAALLADILDAVDGATFSVRGQPNGLPASELSPAELRVLRYLPTNLSRAEIAQELPRLYQHHQHARSQDLRQARRERPLDAVQRASEQRLLSTGPHR
jgi:LuxR family transcriptional regulator, maltose regulon positive regulatory protein